MFEPVIQERRSTKQKFDFCAYERFVSDEQHLSEDDSDKTEKSVYYRHFKLKHKLDESKDKPIRMKVVKGHPSTVSWEGMESINAYGHAMSDFGDQWQIE